MLQNLFILDQIQAQKESTMNTRLQHESLITVSKFLTFIFYKVYKNSISLTRNFIKKVSNKQTNRLARLLKFIYSEKATKFFKISAVDLSYVVPVNSTVEILQNFVAFSEYMNFKGDNSVPHCKTLPQLTSSYWKTEKTIL